MLQLPKSVSLRETQFFDRSKPKARRFSENFSLAATQQMSPKSTSEKRKEKKNVSALSAKSSSGFGVRGKRRAKAIGRFTKRREEGQTSCEEVRHGYEGTSGRRGDVRETAEYARERERKRKGCERKTERKGERPRFPRGSWDRSLCNFPHMSALICPHLPPAPTLATLNHRHPPLTPSLTPPSSPTTLNFFFGVPTIAQNIHSHHPLSKAV